MADIGQALKVTIVGLIVMLILGRLVFHIATSLLLPVIVLLALFFLIFVVGIRMLRTALRR